MKLFYSVVVYVMLSSGRFFSLLKRNNLILDSTKWIGSSLSTNHSHTFARCLLKTFSIFVLMSSTYRYVLLSDRTCAISVIYSKSNKGLNIDPWGNLQFIVSAYENTLSNETKKSSSCEVRMKTFSCFIWKTDALHFV